jgi:hypothetical protein
MAKILASSASERIRSCRRDLVLDLTTQYGPFWLTVDSLRRKWSIEARQQLPPELPGQEVNIQSNPAYRPVPWPDRLFLSKPTGPNDTLVTSEIRPGPAMSPEVWDARCEEAWWLDLQHLHQLFVPEACTRVGSAAKLQWAPFLSACLLYDPPWWGMLRFADTPPLVFDLPPHDPASRTEQIDQSSRMLAAPIIYMQDTSRVREAVDAYWRDVIDLLAQRLGQRESDLWALIREVIDQHPDTVERARARDAAIPSRAYITVTAETTDEDVRAAARLLRLVDADAAPRGGARKMHPLIDVQCAVWHDENGLPFPAIAKIFGWKISMNSYGTSISESARRHVDSGRRILQERLIVG